MWTILMILHLYLSQVSLNREFINCLEESMEEERCTRQEKGVTAKFKITEKNKKTKSKYWPKKLIRRIGSESVAQELLMLKPIS